MYWWSGWSPDGWLPMPFGWILPCLVMMLVCMMAMRGWHGHGHSHDSALDALNERFVRGEIGQAEYNERREAITRSFER